MARTLNEIQTSMLLTKEETASLNSLEVLTTNEIQTITGLDSASKVSIWRLWVFIVSFAIFLHEKIFDAHVLEINALIAKNKIHTTLWYQAQAKLFQLGFEYPETQITGYDNSAADSATIENSKIIARASVRSIGSRLRVKVAKSTDEVLEALSVAEIAAFTQYMNRIKDAGNRLVIISRPPDDLAVTMNVYFDPLVLDANGARLDGTDNTPVLKAIKDFLYNLTFNGEFLTDEYEEFLRKVQGVQLIGLTSISARFGANAFEPIIENYIADAGYMILNTDNTNINYIPREQF